MELEETVSENKRVVWLNDSTRCVARFSRVGSEIYGKDGLYLYVKSHASYSEFCKKVEHYLNYKIEAVL